MAELLIAAVFMGVVAVTIIGATTFAGRVSQGTRERSVLLSLVQDCVEAAQAAAAQGSLVEGSRTITFASGGASASVAGTSLPTDVSDPYGSRSLSQSATVSRTIVRDSTYPNLYRVTVSGSTANGSSKVTIETCVRM